MEDVERNDDFTFQIYLFSRYTLISQRIEVGIIVY